jgi:heme/copper-type cytochrome/quinol oxidase subunit 2
MASTHIQWRSESMKRILMMIAILMVLALGCAKAPEVEQQVKTEVPKEQTQTAPAEETSTQTTEETTPTSSSTLKEFEMLSKRFAFEPNVVRVNEGDTVILHITSPDVAHGIAIPEFGVNTYLPAGETIDAMSSAARAIAR